MRSSELERFARTAEARDFVDNPGGAPDGVMGTSIEVDGVIVVFRQGHGRQVMVDVLDGPDFDVVDTGIFDQGRKDLTGIFNWIARRVSGTRQAA